MVLVIAGLAYYFISLEKEEEVEIPPVPNIVVFSPEQGDMISSPLKVEGEARVFEGTVNLRLKEKDGRVLVEDFTTAQSPEMGQFGPFEKELFYPQPAKAEGILEVFQISARDGSEIDKVIILLKFEEVELLEIKVYLNFYRIGDIDCVCDDPVVRTIPKTQAIARAAIEELIKGPTQEERESGYSACLPTKEMIKTFKEAFYPDWGYQIKINSIKIEDRIAYIDFSEEINAYGGGSCWVEDIRSSIFNTLKQFPTIDDVIISVNGRTKYILQP